MSDNDPTMNTGNGMLSPEDFGLKTPSGEPQQSNGRGTSRAYNDAKEWWRSDSSTPMQQQPTQSNYGENREVDPDYEAFRQAKSTKDIRKLLQLAGVHPTEALANLPSLAQDEHTNSLQKELKALQEKIAEQGQWIQTRETEQEKRIREEKINAGKAKLGEIVNLPQFVMINRLNMRDTIWDAAKNFTEDNKRLPSKDEILRMAIAIENSLRGQAKPLREMEWPGDELSDDSLFGSGQQVEEKTAKPPIGSNVTSFNRPVITNEAARNAEVNSPAVSREERIKRAIEAARRVKGK